MMATVNSPPSTPMGRMAASIVDGAKATGRKRPRKSADVVATISVNGGPAVPLEQVRAALDVVKAQAFREAAAGKPQTDIEEATGVHPKQAKLERDVGGIAAERLRSIVERVERLEEERRALGSDIKDIFAEAKSAGFDVKVVRQVIRDRRREPAELEEFETLLDLYKRALGM